MQEKSLFTLLLLLLFGHNLIPNGFFVENFILKLFPRFVFRAVVSPAATAKIGFWKQQFKRKMFNHLFIQQPHKVDLTKLFFEQLKLHRISIMEIISNPTVFFRICIFLNATIWNNAPNSAY